MVIEDLLQPAILSAISVVGWGVRSLLAKVNELDAKMDRQRVEIREELKEYVRQEMCKAYREALHEAGRYK